MRYLFIFFFCPLMALASVTSRSERTALKDAWAIFPSTRVEATGAEVSTPGFDVQDWYPAKVPSTVLGTLVDLDIHRDPFFSRNLASIPTESFQHSWWYRTEFTVKGIPSEVYSRLFLEGINYRANLWLNGKKIAGKDTLKGTFNVHELDITSQIKPGINALALEVLRAEPGEFSVGFVDWNPRPPDSNLGIWRGVTLRRTGAVSIEHPVVRSKMDLQGFKEAELTVVAELVNHAARRVSGVLHGSIGEIGFEVPYVLAPNERRSLMLTPTQVPALKIQNPRLWWPANLGSPELYTLVLKTQRGSEVDDEQTVTFGVREVGERLDAKGHRCYSINGRDVLIRGAGWVDDLFLREEGRNLEAQMTYLKAMNLNTVRLEGFWGESQKLYDLADRLGLFVMVGFTCHWEWPEYLQGVQDPDVNSRYGGALKKRDIGLLASYLRDQARWLRNHPSLLTWVIGSDKLPSPEAERVYRGVLDEEDPGRPVLSSCKGYTSPVSGPTGVKMSGPYDYVTPNYWFEDRQNGGAFGFNTETGPGPQIPQLSSLKQMFLPSRLWPIGEEWDYHCARYNFSTIDRYVSAFEKRYGKPSDVESFAFKAQAANYEAMRAMFEAYSVNRPEATGVVAWMFNSAWPKLFWQQVDHFLMPNGAYYGAQRGCQPQSVVWDCAHNTLHVVNETRTDLRGAIARVRILRLDSSVVSDQELAVSVPSGTSVPLGNLSPVESAGEVSFLDLRLKDDHGREISCNFYWRSARPDVLDPSTNSWISMGNKSYADFRALDALPKVEVKAETSFSNEGCIVTLHNDSPHLAFFLELGFVDGAAEGDPEVLSPVLWDENDISLLPGESRTIRARWLASSIAGRKPKLSLRGWNLKS